MTIWVHIKTPALSSPVRAALLAKQRQKFPLNLLSVTQNVAGTEAIVKIGGADIAWFNGLGIIASNIIHVYSDAEQRTIFDAVGFYTPVWQPAG